MEIFKVILNSLLGKNLIINLFLEVILIGISVTIFEKLFKTHFSTKNKFIFMLISVFCFLLSNLFMSYIYSYIFTFIISIILFIYLLKISKLQTLIYFSFESIFWLNIQFCVSQIIHAIFNSMLFNDAIQLFIWGITSIIFMSIIGILVCFCAKHMQLDALHLSSIGEISNLIFATSLLNLFITVLIFCKFFETFSNNLFYIFALDLYFCFSILTIVHLCKLSYAKRKIENLQLCNKTILTIYDETRAFKHDFHNIIQAIGGYVWTENMEGLKKYYKEISSDCMYTNNLSKLNSTIINNPAIYNILADKYYIATNHNIQINLEVMVDLNELNMKIYELTRILGILLDNAIEASKECTEKNINISFKQDKYKQILIIENTYNNKQISIEEIFEKDFTTKPNNSGLGLWEVKNILNKNSNLNLHTSKNNDYFSQQLEIYMP